MIKHVVMWKLKESADAKQMKEELEGLEAKIEQIKALEVGINFNDSTRAYDVVLIVEFADKNALEEYQNHPDHLEIVDFVKAITKEVVAVDYEI